MPDANDGTPIGGPKSVEDEEIEPKKVGSADSPVESTHTEYLHNEDNPYTVRVRKDNGEVVASGRTGEVARDSDATTVIQAAVDHVQSAPGEGKVSLRDGETYELTKDGSLDTYGDGNGYGVIVKDADQLTIEGGTLTGAAGEGIKTLLVTSAADGAGGDSAGSEEGEQNQFVNIKNVTFDGKGRDNIALVYYESVDCTVEHCTFTNWAPQSGTFGLGTHAVRAQYYADHITFRDCYFNCNTSIKGYLKFDGSYAPSLINCRFYEDPNTQPTRLVQQNINEDVDRGPVGTWIVGNVFDYTDSLTADVSLATGFGTIIANNRFIGPLDSASSGMLKLAARPAGNSGAELDGIAPIVAGNIFLNTGLSFANNGPIYGAQLWQNNCILAADNSNHRFISVKGGSQDGSVENAQISGNVMVHVASFSGGVANGKFLETLHSNFDNNVVTDNTQVDGKKFTSNPGGADFSTSYWRNENLDVNDTSGTPLVQNGGETTVDDGGTISHGLVGTPVEYTVNAKAAGEVAKVTAVDGTNLTVEVLSVSDGSSAGTGNSVSWSAEM